MSDRFEVGLVSADRLLLDFYAQVFEREELPAIEAPTGTVHRLQFPSAVHDLDGVIARATAAGGTVAHGPMELPDGLRLVVLVDRDGNTIEVVEDPDDQAASSS